MLIGLRRSFPWFRIEGCDMVYTMTSLAGFDAFAARPACCSLWAPVHSGMGLTDDKVQVSWRTRLLCIDELVAGALLYHPIYWDWNLRGYLYMRGDFATDRRVSR